MASIISRRHVKCIRRPSVEPAALFGRFSTVLSEHADLGALLDRMRDLFADLREGRAGPTSDPGQLVEEFRRELRKHFTLEENEQYFGTIAADRPELKGEVLRLLAEHEDLMGALAPLQAALQEPARRTELTSLFETFREQLRTHERAENALLREYFDLRS